MHFSCSFDPFVLPSAQMTCSRAREHYWQTMVWSVLHQFLIINRATYCIWWSTPAPSSQALFHLSELMNRCCSAVGVNMMDGVAGRDILLLRGRLRGGSSGRSIACQGALTFLFFSPSFFHMTDLIHDIQESFNPHLPSPLPHSTLPPTALSI